MTSESKHLSERINRPADEVYDGVLDHDVTLPSGEIIHNPVRVITDGPGCEVVFTLRRLPGMSEEDFERDADAVAADLTKLKRVLEGASHSE
jgi:hypothetical protein